MIYSVHALVGTVSVAVGLPGAPGGTGVQEGLYTVKSTRPTTLE